MVRGAFPYFMKGMSLTSVPSGMATILWAPNVRT